MKQFYFLLIILFIYGYSNAQSYAPPVGQDGTTAIHRDSVSFTSWASAVTVVRGPQNITSPSGSLASVGIADNAIAKSNGQIVSLGDGGYATLTFATPIVNKDGFDFAVFENSFSDTFLELAFVEISSDGINFFRFPSHSETQTSTQVGSFGNIDATYINNLAGKYRSAYGTPFEIDDVPNNALLNKAAITHVKIIDVIGTIDPVYATYDSYGNIINDPYATPFPSSGFDLDAVGVINEEVLNTETFTIEAKFSLFPNPTTSQFYISEAGLVSIYSAEGRLVLNKNIESTNTPININSLTSGIYMVNITSKKGSATLKMVKK
ncbi:T9SS type A sorting domain-containing protein [Lacinutrix mariniflava]|uniref:T9SS type A sorting domain-containing protein n=1 Tax=Lacinutrix mariniflava TaxID=342955 RepID=UPI0006E2192C|nr:T9SS type A sorting domain-containing protein [Lacinutrix mariniflava]